MEVNNQCDYYQYDHGWLLVEIRKYLKCSVNFMRWIKSGNAFLRLNLITGSETGFQNCHHFNVQHSTIAAFGKEMQFGPFQECRIITRWPGDVDVTITRCRLSHLAKSLKVTYSGTQLFFNVLNNSYMHYAMNHIVQNGAWCIFVKKIAGSGY